MHAQAFFTQNGSNNVVVERQFSFNIENDLVSGFDGITKLVYIKSIQDTIEAVGKDFNQLKQNMADTQTLIAKVNDSATKGIQQIEIKQNEAIQAITATQTSATQAVTAEFSKIVEKEQAIFARVNEVEKQINGADLVKGNTTTNWQNQKLLMIMVKQLNRLNSP